MQHEKCSVHSRLHPLDERAVLCDHHRQNHDPNHLTYHDLICFDIAHDLEIVAKRVVVLGDLVRLGVAFEQVAYCKV